jgi:RNA-directed DNA polymerase
MPTSPPPLPNNFKTPLEYSTFNEDELIHLSNVLDVKTSVLAEISSIAPTCYHRFPLSKGNGLYRWIEAPSPQLKSIQKKILTKLLYTRPAHPVAHGFVPNRSIVTNARPHIGKKWVANFDIKNFFPSTKTTTVLTTLAKYPGFNNAEYGALLQLVCRNGSLPQGAPTSPHLANLAMWEADVKLWGYAKDHTLTYTRYADDLTFSGEHIPDNLLDFLCETLQQSDYYLAPGKSKWLGRHKRQMVTGLVVNEKLNLPRPMRKKLRAIIHDIKIHGLDTALERSTLNLDQLIGQISFQAMWDHQTAKKQIIELAAAIGIE